MKLHVCLLFIFGTLISYSQDYRYSEDSIRLKYELFEYYTEKQCEAYRLQKKMVYNDTLNADSLVIFYYLDGSVFEKLLYNNRIVKTESYYPNGNIYELYYAKDRVIIFKPYYTWTKYDEFGDTSLCSIWIDYKSYTYNIIIEFEFIERNGYEIDVYDSKTMKKKGSFKSKDSLLIEDYTCTTLKGRKIVKQFLKETNFHNLKLRPRTRNAYFYKLFRVIPSKTDQIEYYTTLFKLNKRKKNQEDHTNIIYRHI